MSKDTGGPAFPQPTDSTLSWCGMTLRDYFAAKAMQGVVANLDEAFGPEEFDEMAKVFYSMADAMLKAREEC